MCTQHHLLLLKNTIIAFAPIEKHLFDIYKMEDHMIMDVVESVEAVSIQSEVHVVPVLF